MYAQAADDGYGVGGYSDAQLRREDVQAQRVNEEIDRQARELHRKWAEEQGITDAAEIEADWAQRDQAEWTQRRLGTREIDEDAIIEGVMKETSTSGSIRSRLYQRSGLAAPDNGGEMWGVVRNTPDSKGRMLDPIDDISDVDAVALAQERARAYTPETTPGASARGAEAEMNNGSPNSPTNFEPHERAARTSEYPANDAARTQFQTDDFRSFGVDPSPVLTEAAYDRITSPRTNQLLVEGETTALRQVIEEVASEIDVDQLSRDLGQSWEETTIKALQQVRQFLGDNAEVSDVTEFRSLRETVQNGNLENPFWATREGCSGSQNPYQGHRCTDRQHRYSS